jgi:hypothetical protein
MICINPNTKEFKDILAQVGDPLAAEIEYNKQYGASAIKPGVEELFNSNPELASIGTPQQYSQYLDTIFPDSQVKNIVYRGSEKGIEKDEKFWLYFSDSPNDAYLYAKAHISKGGNITERNPINAINIAAQKYFNNKYGEDSYSALSLADNFEEEFWSYNYLENEKGEIYLSEYDQKQLDELKKYNLKKQQLVKEISKEDKTLLDNIKTVKNKYDYVKIESEADLTKPYDNVGYIENIEDYTKARQYIDNVLGIGNVRENIGKLESVILNITNPLDGGNWEDLLNNKEAYQNGHDGATLLGGDHFLIKNNPEQFHILGNKQDIEGFKKFIGSKPAQNPNLSSFDNQRISTINSLNDMIKNFRVDEILAEKGYDVRDIISNLETASNQTELNKIINKLLYLLC